MQPFTITRLDSRPSTHSDILRSQQQSWNQFSSGWQRWDDFTMRFLAPQGTAILNALQLRPGARVLDIATGTGDPGLTLATQRPDVRVTALDASEGMLRVARAKAERCGLDNFDTLVGDACELGFADESFDAVCCRLGFMFFPDPQLAAAEMARVLRPGGVVAATVWAGPTHNSWLTTMLAAAKKHVDLPSPPPGAPGMFRCADPGALPTLLAQAGLCVEQTELLTGQMQVASVQEYWQFMNDVVPPIVSALGKATAAAVAAVRSEVFSALDGESTAAASAGWGAHWAIARK